MAENQLRKVSVPKKKYLPSLNFESGYGPDIFDFILLHLCVFVFLSFFVILHVYVQFEEWWEHKDTKLTEWIYYFKDTATLLLTGFLCPGHFRSLLYPSRRAGISILWKGDGWSSEHAILCSQWRYLWSAWSARVISRGAAWLCKGRRREVVEELFGRVLDQINRPLNQTTQQISCPLSLRQTNAQQSAFWGTNKLPVAYEGGQQGRIQKFQKWGAGSQILERGGRNLTFQCGFQPFSYKSLTNIPAKGEAAARPAPPLNPRLVSILKMQTAECRPGIKCRLSIKCRLDVQV